MTVGCYQYGSADSNSFITHWINREFGALQEAQPGSRQGNAGWVYRAALGTTPEGIMRGLGCLNTCCMETSAKCVGAAG